jgi:ADP-ribose pyrophosphatase YjhB (NUDIX family)
MTEVTRHFVANAYVVKDYSVLLIKSRNGQWIPPGGHVEMDELPPYTAARKCREEAGVEIKLQEKAAGEHMKFACTHILLQPDHMEIHDINEHHQHIAFIYFAHFISGSSKTDTTKLRETKWFTTEDLELEIMKDSVKYFAARAIQELAPQAAEQPPVVEAQASSSTPSAPDASAIQTAAAPHKSGIAGKFKGAADALKDKAADAGQKIKKIKDVGKKQKPAEVADVSAGASGESGEGPV